MATFKNEAKELVKIIKKIKTLKFTGTVPAIKVFRDAFADDPGFSEGAGDLLTLFYPASEGGLDYDNLIAELEDYIAE